MTNRLTKRAFLGQAAAAGAVVGLGTGLGAGRARAATQELVFPAPNWEQARGRVWVGEEGYHLASLGPLPPPMAASQAFPECQYSSLPVVPLPM